MSTRRHRSRGRSWRRVLVSLFVALVAGAAGLATAAFVAAPIQGWSQPADPAEVELTPITIAESTRDQETGPTPVWEENFDTFRPSLWRKEHSTFGDGNNELQCYRPENVDVAGGHLVLRAVRETYTCPLGSTRQLTSGMVRSQGVTFSPGQRIEFRVKVDPRNPIDQRGLWPALWASDWEGRGWPLGGELDWLEYVGTTPYDSHHAIHFQDADGSHRSIPKAVQLPELFSDRWHTITFDWTSDLVWYLDGKEVQRIRAEAVSAADNPFTQSAAPITELRINLALGGDWPGPVSEEAVDSQGTTTFLVDYVRIFDLPL